MNRLDKLLRDFELSANQNLWAVTISKSDYTYIAAVLRAGRELRKANDVFAEEGDAELLDLCETNYDRAVEGTQPEVGNE